MNKKYLAVILSTLLVFGIVFVISGCNKEDNTDLQTESTDVIDNTEQNSEEPSADKSENSADTNGTEETEKESESTSNVDEDKTEVSTSPSDSTTESDEPETCKTCGNIVLSNSYSGNLAIGNYCDGRCDEWLGDF